MNKHSRTKNLFLTCLIINLTASSINAQLQSAGGFLRKMSYSLWSLEIYSNGKTLGGFQDYMKIMATVKYSSLTILFASKSRTTLNALIFSRVMERDQWHEMG